jgi:hypothetical protein
MQTNLKNPWDLHAIWTPTRNNPALGIMAQRMRRDPPRDPRRTSGVLKGEAQHLRVDGLGA